MRRTPLLGVTASLCLLLGTACAGEDEESREDLVEEVSQALQADDAYDEATADCVAELIVDAVGVDALKDVDLSADEPPQEMQEELAAVRASDECDTPDASG